jgi:hypothetical protein
LLFAVRVPVLQRIPVSAERILAGYPAQNLLPVTNTVTKSINFIKDRLQLLCKAFSYYLKYFVQSFLFSFKKESPFKSYTGNKLQIDRLSQGCGSGFNDFMDPDQYWDPGANK